MYNAPNVQKDHQFIKMFVLFLTKTKWDCVLNEQERN